jgi:hypothetical protein
MKNKIKDMMRRDREIWEEWFQLYDNHKGPKMGKNINILTNF